MLNKEISDYFDERKSMLRYHGSALVYIDTLRRQETMMKFDYAPYVETRYLPHLLLTCADLALLNANDVQHGDLYDYKKAFDYLFKYNKRRLNDGVIINTVNSKVKKLDISKLTFKEVTQIIENNLVLINQFNEYYKNVQLIQQIEDM